MGYLERKKGSPETESLAAAGVGEGGDFWGKLQLSSDWRLLLAWVDVEGSQEVRGSVYSLFEAVRGRNIGRGGNFSGDSFTATVASPRRLSWIAARLNA